MADAAHIGPHECDFCQQIIVGHSKGNKLSATAERLLAQVALANNARVGKTSGIAIPSRSLGGTIASMVCSAASMDQEDYWSQGTGLAPTTSPINHRAQLEKSGLIITDFTLDDIKGAAASGCAFSAMLEKSWTGAHFWRLINHHGRDASQLSSLTLAAELAPDGSQLTFGTPAVVSQEASVKSSLSGNFIIDIDTFVFPRCQLTAAAGDPAAEDIPTRPISLNPISSINLDLIRKWLKTCVETHDACPKVAANFMPTRLVKITAGASRIALQLQETLAMTAEPYAALSYCWGGKQEVKTTIDSYPRHAVGIDMDDLPASIQEAVFVVQEIGLEYIWVDALCIIQDDSGDRDVELASMPNIYSQATVTISASRATSVQDGFTQRRNPDIPSSFKLPYQARNGTIGSVICFPRIAQPEEPLDRRGWALQERLLSTRILNFGTLQTRWICRETTRSQQRANDCIDGWKIDLSEGDKKEKLFQEMSEVIRRDNLPSPSQPAERQDAARRWRDILEVYTQRSLTLSADRLPAIAGVAERIGRLTNDRYLAGLWESDLFHGLLWRRAYTNQPKIRYSIYQAPSWSWAAIDGAVDFRYWPKSTNPHISFNFIGSDTEIKYGAVQSGTLFFEALLRPAEWKPSTKHPGVMVEGLRMSTGPLALSMYADTVEPDFENQDAVAVFLMPVSTSIHHVDIMPRGLVLRKMEGNRYSRLGVFEFRQAFENAQWSKPEASDQPKSYLDQLAWLGEGEVEEIELV